MFTYRHIEIFQAVMKTGSMSAAATLLCSSQPTISREIARLEQLCGFALFERKNAKIYPTEAAFLLYEEVLKSHVGLTRIIDTAQHIQHKQLGTLHIGCLPFLASSLLPKAIARFKMHAPQVSIRIDSLETPFLEHQLSSQQFHLGLVENQSIPAGTSPLLEFHSQEVCILPKNHALLTKSILSLEDFTTHDFIRFSAQDPYRQQIDSAFEHANVQRNITIETSSAHAICMMVQQGLGLAIVNPLVMLDYLAQGLEWRPIDFEIPFTLKLVGADYRPKSDLSQMFSDMCFDTLQDAQNSLQQYRVPTQLQRIDFRL